MRWTGHVARMGEKRNAYRLLMGKPEGKETTRKTKIILRWIFRNRLRRCHWIGLA
jgi:hypothetical protein